MAKIFFAILSFLCVLATSNAPGAEHTYLKKAQVDKEGRFHNPWPGGARKSFADFLKWKLISKNAYAEDKKAPLDFIVQRPDFKKLEESGKDYVVWLGHSTVFIKANGKRIITDPVFWDVNFLVKRKTAFPTDPSELPKIDFVLISHGHYDHLNTDSVEYLKKSSDPFFITGPGYEDYFKSLGITKNISLNWTESHISNGIQITSLPVQHWSKRTLTDANKMLWCSFLIEHEGRKIYWVGDTGYYGGFKEIGDVYGPIDVLMLPIGSYEPRWFMKDNHVNPEEALQVARDVKAKTIVPIHWGTFDLTDEPLWLPVKRLKEIYDDKDAELKLLDHGGHLLID